MEVEAYSAIKDFVFGIGIFNSQGICCYGTNTLLEDYQAVSIEGRQGDLPPQAVASGERHLLSGCSTHKRDGYPYDYHRNLYSFLISSRHKDGGIYRPPHSWDFSAGIDVKPPRDES